MEGQIGIVLDYKWAFPKTDSDDDQRAAKYDRDNVMGFWAEPIFLTGDYPQSLREFFGSKLPTFSDDEKAMLKGSADFYGVNTYGGKVAEWNNKSLKDLQPGDDVVERYSFCPCAPGADKSKVVDPKFECGAASSWLWAKPEAMRKYLEHVHTFYKAKKIYVTEFGVDVKGESNMKMSDALNDSYRQEYYTRYLEQIALAQKDSKVPVSGIFAWSLMDNFEWGDGLNFRFGITYVNFADLSRHPKNSAKWWKSLIARMKSQTALSRFII
jgi:beta-glucosidase